MNNFVLYCMEIFLNSLIFIVFFKEKEVLDIVNSNQTLQIATIQYYIKKQYNIDDFINKPIEITADSFRYFLENESSELFKKYHQITPTQNPTFYHELVPYHANGILKKELDYRYLLSIENVNIKHFSSFLNHGDKHEYDKSHYLIKSLNGPSQIADKKFTIVYCLVFSRASIQVIREIKALFHEEAAFIIFYDNKSNRTALYELLEKQKDNNKFKNVYIVDSPRFHVEWGRITQAFPEMIMIQAAIKFFPKSLYVSIHSESDYPIVPPDVIIKFLKRNYPRNYIQTLQIDQWKHRRREEFTLTFDGQLDREVNKVIRYLFPKKVFPVAKWQNGWNWFTMTLVDSQKMIDTLYKKFYIADALEYCPFAEEIIFDTLVAETNISSTNEYLRYIDWRTRSCHPLVYKEEHFDDLIKHRCSLWARKFILGTSDKVLDMIDDYIKNYPKNKTIICNK